MDDDMVKYYIDEDTVLLEVQRAGDENSHDITLVEYDINLTKQQQSVANMSPVWEQGAQLHTISTHIATQQIRGQQQQQKIRNT